MNKLILITAIVATQSVAAGDEKSPRVQFNTTYGDIVIELYPDKAPMTVENFLKYVKSGFFDDTIFHRVIDGFMIQGGGFILKDGRMKQKTTLSPIKNEADNGLKNFRGTIAMARTSDPDSANSQFFINQTDNAFLNFKSKTREGWGYCVFGKVVTGTEVVDKIAKVRTTTVDGHGDVPVSPISLRKASVLE